MVRWWWPGGDVTTDELRREVRVLDEAAFEGAEIQAFRIGLNTDVPANVAARVDDYATPSFYRKVRVAAEEARDRGLVPRPHSEFWLAIWRRRGDYTGTCFDRAAFHSQGSFRREPLSRPYRIACAALDCRNESCAHVLV